MIETLISSKTRIKLLIKFFLNSNNTAYLRNLEDEFKESTNGIRIELNKFEKAGFLNSFTEGNKKIFKANTKHPLFNDLNKIILKMVGVEYVLEYILQRSGGLEKVYLTGQLANGQNSDIIDVVLIGKDINTDFLKEQFIKAEKKLSKTVNYTFFETEDLFIESIAITNNKPLLVWCK